MRLGVLLVGFLLLSAPLAQADDDHRLDLASSVALITYVGTSVADARFTVQCVHRHVCREANPLLAPIVNKHGIGTAMTAKVAFNLGVVGVMQVISHQWPERKKTLFFSLLAANAVNVAVLAHNHRVLSGR